MASTFKHLFAGSLAVLMVFPLAVPAYADCKTADNVTSTTALEIAADQSPEEINEEMIAEASESADSDSATYMGDGPAKPVENWFGCKPGNDDCALKTGVVQATASADTNSFDNPESKEQLHSDASLIKAGDGCADKSATVAQ